jgi:antitoxin MazE
MAETLVRPSRVAQWGNSAAVRLPSAALERAHLHVDDLVEIIVSEDAIVIRRQRPKVSMADLLAKFDPSKHRHDLMLDDAPVGTETQ